MTALLEILSAGAAPFDLFHDLGQRVLDDGYVLCGKFLKPMPATREKDFLLADVLGIKRAFIERAFQSFRFKIIGHDVLRQRRVAADVALGRGVEHFGIKLADNVAEIEVALGQRGDVFAANFAEITFVAFGH